MMRIISRLLYTFVVVIETLIAIRFALRVMNASAENFFVDKVYHYSSIFLRPFVNIVPDSIKIDEFTIDTTALLGLCIYMILAYILIELIKTFSDK